MVSVSFILGQWVTPTDTQCQHHPPSPTDKTDGLSYITIDSYKLAAIKHANDDLVITEKKVKKTEVEYNGIAKGMTCFLRVGEGYKHKGRVIEAVPSHKTMLPPPLQPMKTILLAFPSKSNQRAFL